MTDNYKQLKNLPGMRDTLYDKPPEIIFSITLRFG